MLQGLLAVLVTSFLFEKNETRAPFSTNLLLYQRLAFMFMTHSRKTLMA
jgi:hypothetical protein